MAFLITGKLFPFSARSCIPLAAEFVQLCPVFVKGCLDFGAGQEIVSMLMNCVIAVVCVTKAVKHSM